MPYPRKPLAQHHLEGTFRADRHANWGSVDRELERQRREAEYQAQQAAAEPDDDLDEQLEGAIRNSGTFATFWARELAVRALSVTELAEAAGVSRSTVSRIVNGSREGWPATKRKLVAGLRGYERIFGVVGEEGDDG